MVETDYEYHYQNAIFNQQQHPIVLIIKSKKSKKSLTKHYRSCLRSFQNRAFLIMYLLKKNWDEQPKLDLPNALINVTSFSSIPYCPYCRIIEITFSFKNMINIQTSNLDIHVSTKKQKFNFMNHCFEASYFDRINMTKNW